MKVKIISIVLLSILIVSQASAFNGSPAAKNAKLIVYRKGCLYGSLATYKVSVDDKNIGDLRGTSFYNVDLTPGNHIIAPKQAARAVTIDAKEGETYVVKYKTRIGIFGARPKLQVMTLEEARKDKKFVEQIEGK